MAAEDVAAACRLPVEQALLAKRREYDEPFEILDRERSGELESALAAQGFQGVQGGRFHHVSGQHDKGCAVKALTSLFRRANRDVMTIGLGDSLNDIPLLLAVDVPVAVRSRELANVTRRVPKALVTGHEGPAGWSEAILEILRSQDESA